MSELSSTRRELLAAVAASSSFWLPKSAWSKAAFASNPFTLGVASGSPSPDGFVLWTRLAPEGKILDIGDVTVRWELAHDEGFTRMERTGQFNASSALAHSVHIEITGLESNRHYFYRFHAGAYTSAIGRARTLPSVDGKISQMRLAYASCQKFEHGYFSAYWHMRLDNPDFVLFLGDYIYEHPSLPTAVRSVPLNAHGGLVVSLNEYRDRYAYYKSDSDLQAMHAHCPWIFTWDDHEVQNDYAGIYAGDATPPLINFAQRRKSAYQAYYEHMPLKASVWLAGLQAIEQGGEMRLYESYSFGRLANLNMLDTRQYRDRQACSARLGLAADTIEPSTCSTWNDPKRSMLGVAQEAWLAERFEKNAQSNSVWNLLGQSLLLGQRALRGRGAHRGQTVFWNDSWDGFAPARQRLLDSLQKTQLKNLAVLGGDIHEHWVGQIKADYAQAKSKSLGVEFCGTSITSIPSKNTIEKAPERLLDNPHFVYAQPRYRGYGFVTLSTKKMQVVLKGLENAKMQQSAVFDLAQFEVYAGSPSLERIA